MAIGKTIIIGVTIIITLLLMALLAGGMFGGIYNDISASTPTNTTAHAGVEVGGAIITGMTLLPYVAIVLIAAGLLFTVIGYAVFSTSNKRTGYRR